MSDYTEDCCESCGEHPDELADLRAENAKLQERVKELEAHKGWSMNLTERLHAAEARCRELEAAGNELHGATFMSDILPEEIQAARDTWQRALQTPNPSATEAKPEEKHLPQCNWEHGNWCSCANPKQEDGREDSE